MCGRYASFSGPRQLAAHFDVDDVRTEPLGQRYNVAPTLDVYAVIASEGSRRLGALRWGFIPYWAADLKDAPVPINARVEKVADSNMFAGAFAERRCIIPADGFYEWKQRQHSSRKQPYYVHDAAGDPLAFAGIWTRWHGSGDGQDGPVYSCAILTTQASDGLADLHPRMPLTVPAALWDDWLTADPDDAEHLRDAVVGADIPDLKARAVTDRVNNVRNDGPELLEEGTIEA